MASLLPMEPNYQSGDLRSASVTQRGTEPNRWLTDVNYKGINCVKKYSHVYDVTNMSNLTQPYTIPLASLTPEQAHNRSDIISIPIFSTDEFDIYTIWMKTGYQPSNPLPLYKTSSAYYYIYDKIKKTYCCPSNSTAVFANHKLYVSVISKANGVFGDAFGVDMYNLILNSGTNFENIYFVLAYTNINNGAGKGLALMRTSWEKTYNDYKKGLTIMMPLFFISYDSGISLATKYIPVSTLNISNSNPYGNPLVGGDDDPYSGNETNTGSGAGTTTGGGDGSRDTTNDPIDVPTKPTLSAASAGFINMYRPNTGQMKELAQYMWSDLLSIDTFKKLFADPMECIIGLSLVPCSPAVSGNETVHIGNVSSGISMPRVSSQFVDVDCGTLTIPEYWGSYLDFAPYTKLDIYLPFIGTHALNPDDVMGKTIHIKYTIDILSGACTAFIKVAESVLYSFVGACAVQIPFTGSSWNSAIASSVTIAASIGALVATGGSSAPVSAGAATASAGATAASVGAQIGAAASIAGNVMALKPHFEKTGSMGGTGGYMGIRTPYIIYTRPRLAVPEHSNEMFGYPSNLYGKIGDYSGFTSFQSVHLDKLTANDLERHEIETALLQGVML